VNVYKSYRVLIGLEIHIQLATKSKMFTGAANGFGGSPNSQVDAQVLGLPGTLPVMNKLAVDYAIKVGLALGCQIARHTKWDRKSYYYPDLPKNYQISQYDLPICSNGVFVISDENGQKRTIRIRRAHLEEDAGKLLHEAPGGYPIDHTIVDLNRAGTPLLEIVTEPDLATPAQVAIFAQQLQELVRYLGVSAAQMQMGHMRFEPNVNIHITDAQGTLHKTAITEIKNLNSFNALHRASACEIQRQLAAWEETGTLGKKSTYGWDDATGTTFHQRDKEEANDYRYFPDPDLMPVEVNDAWLARLQAEIGELPSARRQRYVNTLGLSDQDAAFLASDRATGDLFESALTAGAETRRATSLMETLREMANEHAVSPAALGITGSRLAQVAALVAQNRIAAGKETAKSILTMLARQDISAEAAATQLGLLQVSDTGAIDSAIDTLIAQNPKSLQDYRGGKQAALGNLVGLIMKSSTGLNARLVQERLKARLQG